MAIMPKYLYDSFYTPPRLTALNETVEANRALLRERLSKEDRKLVLRIVDDLGLIALDKSYDSFVCGFKLAWQMTNELDNYKQCRDLSPNQEPSPCFVLKEESTGQSY